MKAAARYFFFVLAHKWFVFLAGLRVDCPIWRLVAHDWSKLLPWNLWPYGRQFFGAADDAEGFIRCWVRHQNAHQHHWEYWIPRSGHNRCTPPHPDNEPIEMPEAALREMVADWLGAGRAYNGRWPDPADWTWLKRARPKMRLHPATSDRLETLISNIGLPR